MCPWIEFHTSPLQQLGTLGPCGTSRLKVPPKTAASKVEGKFSKLAGFVSNPVVKKKKQNREELSIRAKSLEEKKRSVSKLSCTRRRKQRCSFGPKEREYDFRMSQKGHSSGPPHTLLHSHNLWRTASHSLHMNICNEKPTQSAYPRIAHTGLKRKLTAAHGT